MVQNLLHGRYAQPLGSAPNVDEGWYKTFPQLVALVYLQASLTQTGSTCMKTASELLAEGLGDLLTSQMIRRCGATYPSLTEVVPFAAKLALNCIASSDALYHDVDHTMLVTLAGHDIFFGRALLGNVNASDYAHSIIACVCTISATAEVFLREMATTATTSIQPAARYPCHGVPPTPQCRPITSIGPKCSCWSD